MVSLKRIFHRKGKVEPPVIYASSSLVHVRAPTALTSSQQVQLRQICDRYVDFDQDLDEIGKGVQYLHGLAQNIGEEVKRQNQMLNEADKTISKNLKHVENVNHKMKKTLEKVG